MQAVDWASWPRREIYEFFSPLSQPWYSVTFRLDVTALYRYAKERGLSFYYSLIYLCTRAVNRTEAFSYALSAGRIVKLDPRKPSFTDLKPGAEHFHIVTLPCEGGMADFCAAAKAKSEAQERFIDLSQEGEGLIYFSCLPWVDLTALTNERDGNPDDAIPRIAWGKYVEENGRKVLGLSLEVNHRFIDGLHIGQFAKELEKGIAELET